MCGCLVSLFLVCVTLLMFFSLFAAYPYLLYSVLALVAMGMLYSRFHTPQKKGGNDKLSAVGVKAAAITIAALFGYFRGGS